MHLSNIENIITPRNDFIFKRTVPIFETEEKRMRLLPFAFYHSRRFATRVNDDDSSSDSVSISKSPFGSILESISKYFRCVREIKQDPRNESYGCSKAIWRIVRTHYSILKLSIITGICRNNFVSFVSSSCIGKYCFSEFLNSILPKYYTSINVCLLRYKYLPQLSTFDASIIALEFISEEKY